MCKPLLTENMRTEEVLKTMDGCDGVCGIFIFRKLNGLRSSKKMTTNSVWSTLRSNALECLAYNVIQVHVL